LRNLPNVRAEQSRGFTLVELMVVVAIIGVLASIAIPMYVMNTRRAKSSEAYVQVQRIYAASRTYILEPRAGRGTSAISVPQFPDTELTTPAGNCCASPGGRCAPDPSQWTSASWSALGFSVDDPHYFRYEYESTGTAAAGVGSSFTARAVGDLDCDGVYSTFEMYGIWDSADLDVHGAGFYSNLITE
jgi:prepilin-type N-terminal cleavage/methylation domain-containing protein